jgi:hypothetical protein
MCALSLDLGMPCEQVRLHGRNQASMGGSPLEEIFLSFTKESPWMDKAAFEAWANSSGHPTSVCAWLSKQMTRVLEVRCLFRIRRFGRHENSCMRLTLM